MYVVCLVWEEYTIGKSKGKKKCKREIQKKLYGGNYFSTYK